MKSQTVAFVAIAITFCIAVASGETGIEQFSNTKKTEESLQNSPNAITAYGLDVVLNPKARTACYQCSWPCSNQRCCPGQFPQCCTDGTWCYCCRR